MIRTRRGLLAIAGGGAAALTILAGVAMAQTPGGSSTPANPSATAPAPSGTPGARGDHNCPDKQDGTQGGGQSSQNGQGQQQGTSSHRVRGGSRF